ncbi:MAG: hypothetical protein ACRD3J_31695 [Thermoanaerobaculia bacterium]
MTAIAGRLAAVKVSGAPVAFTGEATTTLVANTTYQITNAVKRTWDMTVAITVKKDGVAQSAALYTLNRLTGTVTFLADIGVGHTITVDGSYLPLSLAAEAKQFSYTLSAQLLEDNQFGDTDITRVLGPQDCAGSLSRWQGVDTYFTDALLAGNPVVIEFSSNSAVGFDRRMWALLNQDGITAAIAGLIEESVAFMGTPDADGRILSR